MKHRTTVRALAAVLVAMLAAVNMAGCQTTKALHAEAKTPIEEAYAIASEAKGALLLGNIIVKDKSVPPQGVIAIQRASQALTDGLGGLDVATAAYETAAAEWLIANGQPDGDPAEVILDRSGIVARGLLDALTNVRPLIDSMRRVNKSKGA